MLNGLLAGIVLLVRTSSTNRAPPVVMRPSSLSTIAHSRRHRHTPVALTLYTPDRHGEPLLARPGIYGLKQKTQRPVVKVTELYLTRGTSIRTSSPSNLAFSRYPPSGLISMPHRSTQSEPPEVNLIRTGEEQLQEKLTRGVDVIRWRLARSRAWHAKRE